VYVSEIDIDSMIVGKTKIYVLSRAIFQKKKKIIIIQRSDIKFGANKNDNNLSFENL